MSKIIVVGGGPSGMMAALNASKSNHEVILLERNGELGRKLLLTGGGRCNITNNRDIEDFFDKVVNNKKFLYSSFYSFTNKDLLSYFEENNLEYKIETDNDHKVYTKSDKSEEVIEALKSDLKANKVKILYNTKVVDLIIENNTVIGVKTENNQTILADKVIISTGGKSYPNTGSDGMMYEILKKYGHTINKIYPALIPLTVKESFIKKLQGISMRNVEISCKIKKKKIKLYYDVTAGKPYVVQSIKYDIYDPKIASLLKQDSARSLLKEGMYLDVNVLDADRQRITNKLLRNGYYKFNKDYIGYTADTVRNTYNVDLTQHLQMYKAHASDSARAHQQYWINKINFITDYDVLQSSAMSSVDINDSVHYKGYPIYYKDKLYLRPKVLTDNLRFASGDLFNERDVQQTYSSFGRLSALKYTNIRFIETQVGDSTMLDCYVMLTKSKHKSVSFEVEGTNSAGDLGAAASVSFQNRNLFRGSETFMIKFRGAYEVISGLQAGYSNNNYTEYGVETSINFPNFLFPFISSDFKRKIRATTEFGLQYNYQLRPEFLRTMASANWSYKWTQRQKIQHRIDLINIAFL